MTLETKAVPKIFVFCNSCEPKWHSAQALTEDGFFVAQHVCSDHGFILHDMGAHPSGCKRNIYDTHYPEGYEVVFEEDARNPSEEFKAAYKKHQSYTKEQYEGRMLIHKKDDTPKIVVSEIERPEALEQGE